MRIATGQYSHASDAELTFAAQLGVREIVLNTPTLPGDERWEFDDLVALRERCASYGLDLAAIENVPNAFYEDAMLGRPGRDRQIEHYQATIRNMGRAGIPILGFHWMPSGVWRTDWKARGRGGAMTNSFDLALAADAPLTHGREYDADEMWGNYEYFIDAVLPVAEEAGVRLALHPDDPPVPSLGGVARIFGTFEGFARGVDGVGSAHLGIDFCVGSWSEMGDGDVLHALRWFGERDRLAYVHFRDVQGRVPRFTECFLGEGNLRPSDVMDVLLDIGFDGFAMYDHSPEMIGDDGWPWRGEAFATGYLTGLHTAAVHARANRLTP
jgi:mannonate dehydratase